MMQDTKLHHVQVAVFEGKAAVPVLSRFRKLFFLHPKTFELYGHVDIGKWPLGQLLYPLYFKCSMDQALFPGKLLNYSSRCTVAACLAEKVNLVAILQAQIT